MSAGDPGWGSTNWQTIVWSKAVIANMILQYGFNLVLSDTDVIWFKDPTEIFKEHPKVLPAFPSALAFDTGPTPEDPSPFDVHAGRI